MQTMDQLLDEITSLRWSGRVKRWHTLPCVGEAQTVADHSGQAVTLLLMLHPSPSVRLIKAMLWHDTAERHVGDVPAPVRRANRAFADHYEECENAFLAETHPTAHDAISALNDLERDWLKAIDVLELVMWCGDQVDLGNRNAAVVEKRGIEYLRASTSTPEKVREFLERYVQSGARSYA